MKFIYLLKKLSDRDANLLAKIGIKEEGRTLECLDNRYIYFKDSGRDYEIYCYDDSTPVATLFIKRDFWDEVQIINVDEEKIEAALKRISRKEEIENSDADHPSYEERKKMISEGNYSCLFKIPISKLRFDEQDLVKKHGFKCEGSEEYYPLSDQGKRIVELVKKTRRNIDYSKSPRVFFLGREEDRISHFEFHSKILNNLLNGSHELTLGLSKKQITAYFDIAIQGIAPAGFKENDEAITSTAQQANPTSTPVSSNPSQSSASVEPQQTETPTNSKILNNLLNGSHELTLGLSKKQITAYFDIAIQGIAPAGFKENDEAITSTAQQANPTSTPVSSNPSQSSASVEPQTETPTSSRLPESPKLSQILVLFENFRKEIDDINKYSNLEANQAAITLLDTLEERSSQFVQLQLQQKNPSKAEQLIFKKDCDELLKEARPILQKDMELFKSVENFLKRIVNAIVAVVTYFFTDQYQHGIFKSNLQQKTDKLIDDLQDLCQEDQNSHKKH